MNNIAKTGWLISLVLIYSVSTYSQTEIHDEIRELNKKGKSFFTLGQLYDAERSFNKTFGLYLHSDSIEKTAYIETLNGLARIYIIKGKFNKADTLTELKSCCFRL